MSVSFFYRFAKNHVTFFVLKDIIDMKDKSLTFHRLYERYAQDVYRFAYWLCGDRDDAQDIASETFVRVWTAVKDWRTETVKAYLLTIARNLYLKNLHRKDRFLTIDEEIADEANRPDKKIEVDLYISHVLNALKQLSEIDRTVLIMKAEKDLTYQDISQVTGLSVSAIKVKIFRSRIKINKILQEGDKK
jgi:RNA polymerase sigma-70 factor (ECF subfamily)